MIFFLILIMFGLLIWILVIEAKLDNEIEDLRVSEPWGELAKFCDAQDMHKMTDLQFRDTPYPVVLVKAVQQWRSKHNGHLPANRQEKTEFVETLKEMSGNPIDPPQNFKEAITKAHLAWTEPEIPQHVKDVFSNTRTDSLSSSSSDFWFLARALRAFVEKEGKGRLPVIAKLPDMDADTERYIKLQSLYRRKARDDQTYVKKHLCQLLAEHGKPENSISDFDIYEFCKNSHYIHVFNNRNIDLELNPDTYNKDEVHAKLAEYSTIMPFYFCLLAADRFQAKHGHHPGDSTQDSSADYIEKEFTAFKTFVTQVMNEYNVQQETDMWSFNADDYCREFVRWGKCEMHNISSLVGGVAAQELIKLCTRQRLPLNNTWLFNGLSSSTCSFNA